MKTAKPDAYLRKLRALNVKDAAQRRRYADNGEEMVRLLEGCRGWLLFGAGISSREINAALKAVRPPRGKR